MKDARIPPAWRDSCAHLLIPLNECRREHYFLMNKCVELRHAYERCQYEEQDEINSLNWIAAKEENNCMKNRKLRKRKSRSRLVNMIKATDQFYFYANLDCLLESSNSGVREWSCSTNSVYPLLIQQWRGYKTGASIAQLVEHPLRKRQVVCSNPTWGFTFCLFPSFFPSL